MIGTHWDLAKCHSSSRYIDDDDGDDDDKLFFNYTLEGESHSYFVNTAYQGCTVYYLLPHSFHPLAALTPLRLRILQEHNAWPQSA